MAINKMQNNSKIPKQSSSKNDYDLAKNLAQAIGLADHPPISNKKQIRFISNLVTRKEKKRRMNASDLLHLEREANMRKVMERKKMIEQSAKSDKQKRLRKNAVKDIFVSGQKPESNPFIHGKTQQIIFRNDLARVHKHVEQCQILRRISQDKCNRSKILEQMCDNIYQENIFITPRKQQTSNTYRNWLYNPQSHLGKSNKMSPTKSMQKLAVSFDFSRFNLIPQKDHYRLDCKSDERRIQTAKACRRTVRVKFNDKNKCEMIYPESHSESSFFKGI